MKVLWNIAESKMSDTKQKKKCFAIVRAEVDVLDGKRIRVWSNVIARRRLTIANVLCWVRRLDKELLPNLRSLEIAAQADIDRQRRLLTGLAKPRACENTLPEAGLPL